ncbi:enoyl-CoA hydratase/isomerase family protein [Vibrio sp. Of7-15]|uniref:enoyl-CoA hydratase/isomerase family protein n=1 Tax=Vibrio sp. Of7-15 TaxID=2724879 RepID=UPI001EF3CCA6|nr:enoyl-CoA hydratase/isomerase family protein [Vibrio sp. Of7-15]MCG7496234.1 enoyl-CoA hydratase/isomerase family protein [Vibrio sp. Of7-15]
MSGTVNFSELECMDGHKVGIAELDNPASLNALSLTMLEKLKHQLKEWQGDPKFVCVVLKATGEKAFCAGGDIRSMYQVMSEAKSDEQIKTQLTHYFTVEYECDYLIHTFEKPIIVWGHGIVMGGGIGLFVGASHRVITPATRLAMPEITIGLYPDVGGTWFLNQLPEGVGLFLGLTGARLNATDVQQLGLAEHMVSPDTYQNLLNLLQRNAWVGGDQLGDLSSDLDHIRVTELLIALEEQNPVELPSSQIMPFLEQIQAAGSADSLSGVYNNIQQIAGTEPWLKNAKDNLSKGSPISAHICYRQMTQYQESSLAEAFQIELTLSVKSGLFGEFKEGVRALLIDKCGDPNWKYSSIEEVDVSDIDDLFTSLWPSEFHPLQHLQ